MATYKQCSTCCNTKPVEDFPSDRSRKSGYCPRCKACCNEASRAWAAANPEKVVANHARRYKRPADYVDGRKRPFKGEHAIAVNDLPAEIYLGM
ncbi:hypothetical protein [Paraburkholderia sp. D1E]|uniref:hypothetical protein n=1 Tax=Paraburkholderia sp. D1E TaxID=3461398 RepID=UPI0040465385